MAKIQDLPEATGLNDNDVVLFGVGVSASRKVKLSTLREAVRGPAGRDGQDGLSADPVQMTQFESRLAALETNSTIADFSLSGTTVPENTAPGATVGTLASIPPGAVFTLTDDAGGRFSISGNNLLTGTTATNYEAATSHSITIHALLGSTAIDRTLSIAVTNVAEITSVLLSGNSVVENSASGVVVGALSSVPAGASFSILDSAGGRFTVSGGNLVTSSVATNYESTTFHVVTVRATRGGETVDQVFTINVLNAVEIASVSLSASTIAEGAASTTVVGTLASSPTGAAFSLLDNAGGRFALSGNFLVASTTATDYETATSHSVVIRAQRGGETLDQAFIISVSNVYEAATLSALAYSASTFNTSATPGTIIAAITGKTPGSVLSISPNDGRISFNGAQNQLLVGLTASSAGTIAYTITETLADSANSPRANGWSVTAVASAIPVNTSAPIITGADTETATLTVSTGSWNNAPTGFTYQWMMGGSPISGAIGSAWVRDTPTIGGGTITCVVTATNASGSTPQVSNTVASTINGILTGFAIRGSGSVVDSRWALYTGADNGTTVSRSPGAGPAATYSMGTSGSVSYGGTDSDDIGYGHQLNGYIQIAGGGGRVFKKGLPLNVPLRVRVALGPGFITHTSGCAFYDGDPDAGGNLLWTMSVSTPADYMLDASGATVAANLWDATNTGRAVTLTVGRTGGLGEIWIRQNPSSNTVYLRAFRVEYATYGVETAGVGPYFVKSNGDNTKDGKSVATAWKNMPGDPDAVGGVVSSFTLLPGAVVNVEGGQVHKPGGFGSRTTFIFQKSAGSSGSPITIQPRAGTGEPIFDGSEDLPFTTAASSGDVFANPNLANITYELQSTPQEWIVAPVSGGVPLRPAVWPKPADITAYDFSDPGSESYWPEDTVSGPGGSSPLFVTGAIDTSRAGYRQVTYSGTKVLTRYGSVSINGYIIMCRFNGNQIDACTITGHNTATGAFTFEIPNGQALYAANSDADFLWQIRYHPFDILEEGQYGYNVARTKPLGWFPVAGTRGLIRLNRFMTAQYSDWTFTGIQVRNLMGAEVYVINDADNIGGGHQYHPNRIKFSGRTRGTSDYGRYYLFQTSGAGTGWEITDLDIADNFTKGGVAMLITSNALITRMKARESGRTLGYNGGVYPNQSHDITWSDIDFCDGSGIHANGSTAYQDSQRIKLLHVLGLNHARPSTNQGWTAGFSRQNEIGYAALTGRIQPAGSPHPTTAITMTNDNGGTDCWWHHLWVGEARAVHLGNDSASQIIENCYFSYLEGSAGVLTGITFRNVVICTAGGGTYSSTADLTANGATVGYNVTFTSTPYDGTFTALARQRMTAIANTGTYADINIGTTARPWNIPAYGTAFALADISLSTQTVRKGHRALLPFGQLFNTKPESSLSLPAGVSGSNNALFSLIRGKVYFLANAVAGTYNLDVMETNASADRTGASTRTTRFVITVA